MGLLLKPNEIQNVVLQMKANLGNTKEAYGNTFRGILGFAQNDELKAESWDKAKSNYEEAHQAISMGMCAVQSSIQVDLETLESIIGNEELDEEQLLLQIQNLVQECEMYEEKIATLELMKNSDVFICSWSICMQISNYKTLLQNTKSILEELKKKLQTLYEKENASSALFSSITDLLQAVECAINDAGVYINGTGILSDGSWKTTIPTTVKDIGSELLVKILNEKLGMSSQEFINEYGDKAFNDIKNYILDNYFSQGLTVDRASVEVRINCELLEDVYEEQFGFDDRTTDILSDVYMKTYAKYGEETDWYFARALSQLGGYDTQKLFNVETNAWFKGAGMVYEHEESKEYFCNTLGIDKEDYNYMRYSIRLQHFISSSPESYSYDYVYKLSINEKDRISLKEWMKNMETAYGDDAGDLEDTEKFEIYLPLYLERYQGLSEKYQDKGDFSHMMYTISANQIDTGKKVDNYFVIAKSTGLYWKNAEERKDIVGWLGDAVFEGDEGQVSFGNSDYIADLDADNIAHRINKNGMSLPDTMLHYYSDLENVEGMDTNLSKEEIEHNNRTREFLSHNKYEDIETAIFERIKAKDVDKDRKLTYKDLKDISKYGGTYNFLNKLKECMNEA